MVTNFMSTKRARKHGGFPHVQIVVSSLRVALPAILWSQAMNWLGRTGFRSGGRSSLGRLVEGSLHGFVSNGHFLGQSTQWRKQPLRRKVASFFVLPPR